jgi:CBS domain-containing protein
VEERTLARRGRPFRNSVGFAVLDATLVISGWLGVVTILAEMTPEEAQLYFERYRCTAFPLTDRAGRAIGLITVDRLARARRSEWSTTTVGELADRDPALLIDERADVADLLEQPAFSRVGRAAVVDASGRQIGIVSLADIERVLRATSLRNPNSISKLAPRT